LVGRTRRESVDVDGGGDGEEEEERKGALRTWIEEVERGRRSFAL
jgi:hypothetical protein